MKENEVLTTSCENLEPSFHTAYVTTAENESKYDAHGATLTEGKTSLDMLNYTFIEQLVVEPSLDLSLSHDDFIHISCDKDDLCDNTFAIHVLKPLAVKLHMLFILLAQMISTNCCLL
jgi:hypothetical protein